MKYYNPIIPGFHPDPSICRVDDDYYLVTSSFEYFPGVPIYHSKNLVNWKLINYCLTRDSQLNLEGCNPSGGIYAPTLRYHDGIFFMSTTNVNDRGNFIVHTKDIYGEWSEPAWIKQRGIDPSLFWDDDGTCYFVSNGSDADEYDGLFLCKIDPFSGEMLSRSQKISPGCGGKASEAPHIYKKNGFYYLMIAEGGTEYGHTEKILRSMDIFGPYEECPHNPILSHVENGDWNSKMIQATGHADLLEDKNGNWWAVCLGVRPDEGFFHHLGRETFLSPMRWDEDGWPVIGFGKRIGMIMTGNLPAEATEVLPEHHSFKDEFKSDTLDLRWNFVRNPVRENYILENGKITLKGTDITLSHGGSPTMIAVRQQAFNLDAITEMEGDITEGQMSGITAFHNEYTHYDIALTRDSNSYYICLRKHIYDINVITERKKLNYNGKIRLKIEPCVGVYKFFYEQDGMWLLLGTAQSAALSSEAIYPCSFTGTFLGLFSEKGIISFDSFEIKIKDTIPYLPDVVL